MTPLRVTAVLAFIGLAGAILASAQRTIPQPVIRDSAGIRIIEYPELGPVPPPTRSEPNPFAYQLVRVPAAFRVEKTPYLDLGGVQNDERAEFEPKGGGLLSAVELSDGTIVVNDLTQLKFFSSSGKFLRAAGRAGVGPGEFRQTREVCRFPGDTVLAIEYAGGRLTLWNSKGQHLKTLARPGAVQFGGCLPDGTLVVREVLGGTANNPSASTVVYRTVRPDGTGVRELARLREPRYPGVAQPVATVVPVGTEVYVASARTYEVQVHDNAERIKRIIRLLKPAPPITDKEWKDRQRGMIPLGSTPKNTAAVLRMIGPKPDGTYPAYSRVLVDPSRRLWISDFESQRSWTVFDSTGRMLGRLELPWSWTSPSPALVGVAADHIIVRELDDDGAFHVRFYRFRK